MVNSSNRQAASNHLELFRACVGDFIQFLSHKRKVDEKVVSTVLTELKTDPLASGRDLQTRVNGRLRRDNLSVTNINVALEAILCQGDSHRDAKAVGAGRSPLPISVSA